VSDRIRIQVQDKELRQALMQLNGTLKNKAKVRTATKKAASHLTHKLRTRPTPQFLVTPSYSKSVRREKGFKKTRNYTYKGGRGITVTSGNLRKSHFTVPSRELKNLAGHTIGTKFIKRLADATNMGKSVSNSSGWYQGIVNTGTKMRITKKGYARGMVTANPYVKKIVASNQAKVYGYMTQGFERLFDKEARKARLK
jgi:hypothetical protein